MKCTFKNKKITGNMVILPEQEILFEDEISNYNFPEKQTLKLKKIMGYEKHRIVKPTTSVSDLCVFGIEYLIDRRLIKKEEIGAIVLVTQSPDYFMPPTSNVIQGRLGLSSEVICMDINQGCAGYLLGLMQAFMLLESFDLKNVLLLNADILSKKVSKQDRNSYPLIGDAACINVVERSIIENEIFVTLNTDGSKHDALIIEAGGFKIPVDGETGKLIDAGDGNLRSKENLKMDGAEVFNFVQRVVPPMIEELLRYSGVNKEEVECFLFHQPNKFMLEKLADKMQIERQKMPSNIVSIFGNSSGCTIPLNMAYNLGEALKGPDLHKCCLAGFGSGLTWGSMMLDMGNMDFNETIVSPY